MSSEFLTQVLGQNEHIGALIKQCADELLSVNGAVHRVLANSDGAQGAKTALEGTEAVTRKLQDASERLTVVNQALQIQIRDRIMVDHQLAAAMEQQAGSRNAALHDNLTGLPNRVLFVDRLEHGIAQATRRRWILAVMFVDLDNFKSINDSYGHQTGDAVLQAVAERLGHNTRSEDTVSRYGGDEFLYLLTSLDEQKDIVIIASKILKAIQMPCTVRVGDAIVNLCPAASIGISVFPKDGSTAAALIQRADEAMYAAKEKGSGIAFA